MERLIELYRTTKGKLKELKAKYIRRKYVNQINLFRQGKDYDPNNSDPKMCFLKGNFYAQSKKSRPAQRHYQIAIDTYNRNTSVGNAKDRKKYFERLLLMYHFITDEYPEMMKILCFPIEVVREYNSFYRFNNNRSGDGEDDPFSQDPLEYENQVRVQNNLKNDVIRMKCLTKTILHVDEFDCIY